MDGYIKLYRKIKDCWIWETDKANYQTAWIDLLLRANHRDTKIAFGNEFIELKAGSFITSKRKLGEVWKWSNTKVNNFFELLEKDNMITVKSDTKKSLITIVNWELYQGFDDEETSQKNNKNITKTQQKHTDNNDNNNIKENVLPKGNTSKKKYGQFQKVLLTDDELERLYKDYGKELTDKAIDYLDGYIVEKKYKSASHNLAMRRWVFDAVSKKNYSNTYNNTNIVKQEEEKKDENGIPEDISRRIAQLKKQGYTDEQLKLVADFKPYLS